MSTAPRKRPELRIVDLSEGALPPSLPEGCACIRVLPPVPRIDRRAAVLVPA